jgi:hypothetical protein
MVLQPSPVSRDMLVLVVPSSSLVSFVSCVAEMSVKKSFGSVPVGRIATESGEGGLTIDEFFVGEKDRCKSFIPIVPRLLLKRLGLSLQEQQLVFPVLSM